MNILVTGGAGVLGSAVLRAMSAHEVVALTHRRDVAGVKTVTGDLTRSKFGLPQREWEQLANQTDWVVHCAAEVDFTADGAHTTAINVSGVQHVVEFAQASGGRLAHVSTAYIEFDPQVDITGGSATMNPARYLDSKRAGEEVVRASGLPATIVRPSVIAGDSVTGEIAQYQGLHSLIRSALKNSVPIAICDRDSHFDFVPNDLVAKTLLSVVEHEIFGETLWVTAGNAAPTAQRVMDVVVDAASEVGIQVDPPRLVDMDFFGRLLKPAFFDDLDARSKTRLANLVATVSELFRPAILPTSLGRDPRLPQPLSTTDSDSLLQTTVRYIAEREGLSKPPFATVSSA